MEMEDEIRLLDVIVHPVTKNSQDSVVIRNNSENLENQDEDDDDYIEIIELDDDEDTENSQDSVVIMNNSENEDNQDTENSQDSVVIMNNSENVDNQDTENSQDCVVIMNHSENVDNQVTENSQDSIVIMNNTENVENQVTENSQDSVVIMNNSENVENQINKTPDKSVTEGHKKLVIRIETICMKNCIIHIENCREQAIALGAKWPEKDKECEDVSDDDDDVHKFVWGLWNRKKKAYYPAITYHKNDVNPDYIPIIWFGENQVSTMRRSSIFPFRKDFVEKYNANNENIRTSVRVTLKLMAKMSDKHYNDNQLISWAVNGFKGFKKDYTVLLDFLSPILQKVKENEEKNKRKQKTDGQHHRKKQRKVEEEESDAEADRELTVNLPELLKSKNMKDICLYCNRLDRELVPHPIFEGALCKYKCSKRYKANIFVIGNDQKQVCCTICGRAGDLTVCDTENCTKSYCERCLKSFLKEEHVQKIEESPQWHCFLCSNEILENCVLKIQTQWNIELLQFLDDNKHRIRYTDFANKGPINVLSLFDGIGTGLQVLKELGIKVNNYFASEIDENAITVAKMNHKVSIIHMGDINDISRERLYTLPKIDLVLGGSPCNDFSLANPARKNIEETSESRKLFGKFIELLNIVKELNSNMFYLFENVCPMEKQTLDHITGAFNNEEPASIDAKHFSPMKRSRYFWGNIPGLHGIPEFWSKTSERNKFTLQDYLEPDLNRTAMMETIKTVTSQPNSLIQKGRMLPVVMGDKPSQLWAKELERLFGFPVHYTEANLNPNQRLALLGKSWSVEVIKSILCPLKNFFECD